MKLIPILLLFVILFSCNSERKEKEYEAANALKNLLPKQDTTIQFDHFIFIDSTETYYFDEIQVSSESIAEKIKEAKEAKSNLKIQLEVDKNVKMDKLIGIMNVCKHENVELKMKSK